MSLLWNPIRRASPVHERINARDAVYHFTPLVHAVDIVSSNQLGKHDLAETSLTRNRRLNLSGLSHSMDRVWVRFVLDRRRLTSSSAKVRPFRDQEFLSPSKQEVLTYIPNEDADVSVRNEYEERVYQQIKNLDSYLISIDVPEDQLKDLEYLKGFRLPSIDAYRSVEELPTVSGLGAYWDSWEQLYTAPQAQELVKQKFLPEKEDLAYVRRTYAWGNSPSDIVGYLNGNLFYRRSYLRLRKNPKVKIVRSF